ncbi:hypothetical protein IE81DRAFT_137073 [Ceraceosorus guamensis]|uniref:Pal1-domain-containing protein n=1 Tax=Ceraceosorus guamensis TaxID=1522189 RepID=A0A316VXV7_9BASI|nr:hypothetical protein IE81DRAFT_137073 [Ceraceosorus guamensis]PWN42289.1 hypothetical protein IE81DRAFT_137073 [Ceraceosorus guamensis]
MTTASAPPGVPTKDSYDPLASAPPTAPPKSGGMGARFANAFRRQTTEEKEAKRREKEKRMREEMSKHESKSSRMDVIDRLDSTGLYGASLFHHDSPYDACTPHANRHARRAPVGAFDPNIDPVTGKPVVRGGGQAASSRPNANGKQGNLSEFAQGTLRKLSQNDSFNDHDTRVVPALYAGGNNASTPTAESIPSGSRRPSDAPSSAWGDQSHDTHSDAANPHAEIWGVASEPWQDFASPAAKERQAKTSKNSSGLAVPSGTSSRASSVYDMEAVMSGRKPGDLNDDGSPAGVDHAGVSPFPERDWSKVGGSEAPKRSKSLLKRVKSARQNPNVPPPDASDVELAAMGRGNSRRGAGAAHRHSPSTPPMGADGTSYMGGYGASTQRQASNLGRHGTLRPRGAYDNPEGGSSSSVSPAGTPNIEIEAYGSAPEAPGGEIQPSTGNLGRQGSIFGRLGKSKGSRHGKSGAAPEPQVGYAR